jgi:DNA replication protein DnaC
MDELEWLNKICKKLLLSNLYEMVKELEIDPPTQDISKLEYLKSLLEYEYEQRNIKKAIRRLKNANFPKVKTIESFDFKKTPGIQASKIKNLLECDFIDTASPIILLGEPGTGKTHLATAIGYAAANLGHTVKFVTASKLANDLVEARDAYKLSNLLNRYSKVKLLIIDELGYLPLGRTDAELLFQVISDRHELLPLIITTNLPFNEWTNIFVDKRLCRALIDRVTHNANIVDTGITSVRLVETLKKHKAGK